MAAGRDHGAADRAADERAADHGHAADAVHQPAGGADRERSGREEDRRPEAEDSFDSGDRDEGDGAERGCELERAGVRDETACEEERIPADVTPHESSVFRSPSANASAPPWDGCLTYGALSASAAMRPTATTR